MVRLDLFSHNNSFTWLPQSYFLMVSFPWIALWQLGFLLLGVWTIWMLRQFKLPFRLLGYGLDWAMGLIALALILSGFLSEFPQVAAWNISMALSYGVLLYVLRNWLDTSLTVHRLWMGATGVGVVTSAISLGCWVAEILGGVSRRNGLPMGNPNFVAGYLLLVLPLTIAFALSRKGWQRLGGFLGSALMATVLYTTSSRGGLLGVLILALVGAGFFIAQSRGKQRQQRLAGCLFALAVVLLIIFNHPRVQELVKPSFIATAQPVVQVDQSTQERLLMWRTGLNILKNRPLFGVGSGNMARVYNLYRPLETGRGGSHIQQLHNTPIQIMGELGLVGLGAVVLLFGCLSRLWYRLYQKLSEPTERKLLYGVGGGLLAYGVSSLTDYQLENISISSTLVVMVALLIGLADRSQSTEPTLKNYRRRWLSLGSITALVLAVILWLPVTCAMYFSWAANRSLQRGNLVDAQAKTTVAARLVPWDPTYSLLAGFQLLKIQEGIKENQLSQELNEIAVKHFQDAVNAAPYDAFFNRNLGVVYQDVGDTIKAQEYLSKAVQLLPQISYFTYYLLGQEYLNQQKIDQAIAAFFLQGLIAPEFLTLALWSKPPLLNLKDAVLRQTLSFMDLLEGRLSASYDQIYENAVILRWWHQKPLVNLEIERLRPLTQALIVVDSQPQKALEIIDKELERQPVNPSLLLFRAWINPNQYLDEYLNTEINELSQEDKELLKKTITQYREIKNWLVSSTREVTDSYRNALNLTYRNFNAPKVAYILAPEEVQINWIVQLLDLFRPYPLELPSLDRLINQVRDENF